MLMNVSYLQTIQKLIFTSTQPITRKIADYISWGLMSFCSSPLRRFSDEDSDFENDAIPWILRAISVLIEMDIPKVQSQSLMALIRLTDHHEIGDKLIEFNIDKTILHMLVSTQDEGVRNACQKAIGSITSSILVDPINKLLREGLLDVINMCIQTDEFDLKR